MFLIIWIYVPAGFAHTDDMKIHLYISIQYLYLTLKPVSRFFFAGMGGAMCA